MMPPRSIAFLTALVLASSPLTIPLSAAEKSLPADLALVPQNAGAFVTIRVADLAGNPLCKPLLAQLGKEEGPAAETEKELGVPLMEIERVTILPTLWLKIVRTIKPYDRDRLLEKLVPKARVKRYGGKTVYEDENTFTTLYLPEERVYVIGRVATQGVFERLGTKGSKGVLHEALVMANQTHHVVIGVNPAGYIGEMWTEQGVRMQWSRPGTGKAAPAPVGKPDLPEAPKEPLPEKGPPPPPPGTPPPHVNPPSVSGTLPGPPLPGPGAIPPRPDGPPPAPKKPAPLPPEGPPPFERGGSALPPGIKDADIQEFLKRVPPEGLPFKPLLLARWTMVTVDISLDTKVEGRVTFPDQATTQDGETAIKTLLYVAREELPQALGEIGRDPDGDKQFMPILQQVQGALKSATVKTEGPVVAVSAHLKVDPLLVAQTAIQLRRSADVVRSSNNLKQIVLAFHNFHDSYNFMPPAAICSKDGKPLLSWRVAILPYIEQEPLYRQFKLDEPWDSPNNKKLLAKMPAIYAPVHGQTKEPYTTYYQVFVGPATPFNQKPDGSQPWGARGPKLPNDFPDGTSNTLLVVEAGQPVPWSKPEDIPYDEKMPVPKVGGLFASGFHAAMVDGSVPFFSRDIDEQTLRYLIMPADGNPVDWSKYTRNNRGR